MWNFVSIILSVIFLLFVLHIMGKSRNKIAVRTVNDNCRFEYELIIDRAGGELKILLYSDTEYKSIDDLIKNCSNIERTRSDFIYHKGNETILISNSKINMISMTRREVEKENEGTA